MHPQIFLLHALSALHVGTGQSAGPVDLPIARARASNLPLVPGSALKGVLRDALASQDLPPSRHQTLFGPESHADTSHAGAITLGDAQLLILPVRAFQGLIGFCSSPFVLRRYARDRGLSEKYALPSQATPGQAWLPHNSALLTTKEHILLEDLDIQAHTSEAANTWAHHLANSLYPDTYPEATCWREEFISHFAILHDQEFSFLADNATEVRARVRIDTDTRTVARGALWYEENLPAESVLWGLMGFSPSRNPTDPCPSQALAQQLIAHLPDSIQIGGKHTIGRGLCRLLLPQD